jgi:hypothetical protein
MDTHGATKKAAVAGLELIINFVMHDHWFWVGGLGCVPVALSVIQPAGE